MNTYLNEDYRGKTMDNKNFQEGTFTNVDFSYAVLNQSNMSHCIFTNCNFRQASLRGVDLSHSVFYNCTLEESDISGANFHGASLNDINVDGVIYDDNTSYFKLRCPQEGAFLGYKKLQDDRVAMLLIPAEAKRTSATLNTCRCSMAKVLAIRSFDQRIHYDYGVSTINDDFIYRVGQWVYADSFEENRWIEATHGIHFWMSFEEACGY